MNKNMKKAVFLPLHIYGKEIIFKFILTIVVIQYIMNSLIGNIGAKRVHIIFKILRECNEIKVFMDEDSFL